MLKERRRLVLVVRETPLSLIHLRNMTALTEAGAVLLPTSPSFYSRPAKISEDLCRTVTERVYSPCWNRNAGLRGEARRGPAKKVGGKTED